MNLTGTRQERPALRGATRGGPRDDQRCGVLISGSVRRGVFVATDVFIAADTLGGEEAIRAWLAQHEIRVVLSPTSVPSPPRDSTVAGGS
jgi:hypothetical protein